MQYKTIQTVVSPLNVLGLKRMGFMSKSERLQISNGESKGKGRGIKPKEERGEVATV